MKRRKNIFAIVGSASKNSANQKLIERFALLTADDFNVEIYNDLKSLPHFDPEQSIGEAPQEVVKFRQAVSDSDGVLICTPEYVFSIPSGLKNAIEWCVSTTVFSDKPIGLITASAHGQKGHEELQLIMRTVTTRFTDDTTLLVPGIKGKINGRGEITNDETAEKFSLFIKNYKKLIDQPIT